MADERKPASELAKPAHESRVVIEAAKLFQGGRREICIQHAGVEYRLRITRRNRLILQK